jgi:hypothetical protein
MPAMTPSTSVNQMTPSSTQVVDTNYVLDSQSISSYFQSVNSMTMAASMTSLYPSVLASASHLMTILDDDVDIDIGEYVSTRIMEELDLDDIIVDDESDESLPSSMKSSYILQVSSMSDKQVQSESTKTAVSSASTKLSLSPSGTYGKTSILSISDMMSISAKSTIQPYLLDKYLWESGIVSTETIFDDWSNKEVCISIPADDLNNVVLVKGTKQVHNVKKYIF